MKKMKMGGVIVLLLAAAMLAMAAAQGVPAVTDKDLESEESMWNLYERWRNVYKKQVSSREKEKERRFEVFKANARHVHEFNKRKDVSYTLGLNKFSDLTMEEFRSIYTGALPGGRKWHHGITGRRHSTPSPVSAGDVPSAWDWRDYGAVTPVKDQGDCGSCWAFSMVGAVEGINAIITGNLLTLSEQEVLDCSGDGDCSGGYIYDAFLFAIYPGLVMDQCGNPPYYPAYDAQQEECRFNWSKFPIVRIDDVQVMQNTNEAELMYRVSKQPVSVLVDASEFYTYGGGVYSGPCGTNLNHAVVVVGYGTTPDGIDYWIIKNSWGAAWGESGYIRMQRNVGTPEGLCGIYEFPIYPIKNCPCPATSGLAAAA